MATNKKNVIEEMYGIDFTKVKLWLKTHGVLISTMLIIGFAFGYYKGQSNIALDCKYAKAVRIDSEAFECRRIL